MQDTQKRAYVFAPTEEGYQTAAVVELGGNGCVFRYGKRWLDIGYAFDPINLPLQDRTFTHAAPGVFGVCADAGPDAWGRKVLLASHRRPPRNEIEFLLGSRGTGVGALRYSLSRANFLPPPDPPRLAELEQASEAVSRIDDDTEIDSNLLNLVLPGSSFGGARPKAVFREDRGTEYLVKFPRLSDVLPESELEFLWSAMAEELGIAVSPRTLIGVPAGQAIAYERFDRDDRGKPLHYLSAHALLNIERARLDDPRFSYREIAHRGRRFVEDPEGFSRDLYRRMVFNVLGANTDDHTRNIGFLYDPYQKTWRLSPAFDLLPHLSNAGQQALIVGSEGRRASVANLLSECGQFGLSKSDAVGIVQDVGEAFTDIESRLYGLGVQERAVKNVSALIEPLRKEALSLQRSKRVIASGPQQAQG